MNHWSHGYKQINPAESFIMWQEKLADLLKNEIELSFSSLSASPCLCDLVKEPLIAARRGLNAEIMNEAPWPLLPLIVSEAVGGEPEKTLPAAAAMQFFLAAGDVFDDIEDADSSNSLYARYGFSVATAAATTLLMLGELSLDRLSERGVDSRTVVQVIHTVNSYYVTACTGQHLDLSLQNRMKISEGDYLKIIAMKSASQIECACTIGAILGRVNQKIKNKFAIFGHNLGMAFQLNNDIRGIVKGNDIINRRFTFPIMFVLSQNVVGEQSPLLAFFDNKGNTADQFQDPAQIREILFQTGAMHYAAIKVEYYKQLAMNALLQIERSGYNIKRFMMFLT